jgi:hypothetical protein
MAAGAASCWCFATKVTAEALARIPEAARGKVCLCRGCATARPAVAVGTENAPARIRKAPATPPRP